MGFWSGLAGRASDFFSSESPLGISWKDVTVGVVGAGLAMTGVGIPIVAGSAALAGMGITTLQNRKHLDSMSSLKDIAMTGAIDFATTATGTKFLGKLLPRAFSVLPKVGASAKRSVARSLASQAGKRASRVAGAGLGGMLGNHISDKMAYEGTLPTRPAGQKVRDSKVDA